MRFSTMFTVCCLIGAALVLTGAGPVKYSEELVTGATRGNHDPDCLVIRPWSASSGPGNATYPVIAWAK